MKSTIRKFCNQIMTAVIVTVLLAGNLQWTPMVRAQAAVAATDEDKEAFRQEVIEMLFTGDSTVHDIRKYNLTFTEYNTIFQEVIENECKVVYQCYHTQMTQSTKDGNYMDTFWLYNSDAGFPERWANMQASIEEVQSGLDEKMSDLEKTLYIHDWLVNHTYYYIDDGFSWVAGGPLGLGYGVCAGYRQAMILLLELEGIECLSISSDNHGWLAVKLDGEWYHVDPTWDDTRSSVSGKVSHKYFLRNDSEFSSVCYHPSWKYYQEDSYGYWVEGTVSTSTKYSDWYVHDIVGDMFFHDGYWYYAENGSIVKNNIEGTAYEPVISGSNMEIIRLTDGVLTYKDNGTIYEKNLTEDGGEDYDDSGDSNNIETKSLDFIQDGKKIESLNITQGESTTISLSNILPADTTDSKYNWEESQGLLDITAAADGKTADVTALSAGTTSIIVTGESGAFFILNVTVKAEPVNSLDCAVTVPDYDYTGEAIEALPSSVTVGTVSLEKDIDYIITGYKNNIAAGTATIQIQGIGNYSGEKEAAFRIRPRAVSNSTADITYTSSYVYTGSTIKPSITIRYNGIILVNGKDYKVTYPAAINVGSYTLNIEFMGNYSGTLSKTYKITAKSASGFTVKSKDGKILTSLPSQTYTSKAITQTFYVYDGTKKLTEGIDYTVKYSNNINAGTASVTISGKGNYLSTTNKTIKFIIRPYSLTNVTITSIADKTYTGSQIKPSLVVKSKLSDGTYQTLKAGTDYKVTYSDNINTGRATAKITAGTNGNYSSSKTKNFRILPKQVTGVKQSSASQKSVKLSWTKVEGAVSGYAVYKYNVSAKKYTYVMSTSDTSAVVSKRSAGTSYVYAVRAYKKVGTNTKYYSPYSANVTTYTIPKAPSIRLSVSAQSVTVKWDKISGAAKYYIYYSTDGGKTYKKAGSSSTNTYTIRSLTKGKKVYVKVKSVKTINGKEYLSPYSTVKSITVK